MSGRPPPIAVVNGRPLRPGRPDGVLPAHLPDASATVSPWRFPCSKVLTSDGAGRCWFPPFPGGILGGAGPIAAGTDWLGRRGSPGTVRCRRSVRWHASRFRQRQGAGTIAANVGARLQALAALRAPSGFHPHGLGPTNRNRRFQPETAHCPAARPAGACPAPTPTRARHRRRPVHRSLAGLHREPTRYAIGKVLQQLYPRQLARVARSGQIRMAASMHIVDMLYLFTRYVMPVGATDIASSRRCPIQPGRSARPTAPGARPRPRPERIQARGRSDCRGCGCEARGRDSARGARGRKRSEGAARAWLPVHDGATIAARGGLLPVMRRVCPAPFARPRRPKWQVAVFHFVAHIVRVRVVSIAVQVSEPLVFTAQGSYPFPHPTSNPQGAPQLDEALANLPKHALQGLPVGALEVVPRSFGGGGGPIWVRGRLASASGRGIASSNYMGYSRTRGCSPCCRSQRSARQAAPSQGPTTLRSVRRSTTRWLWSLHQMTHRPH